MGTSRTGTSRWKHLRAQALREAQAQGITHCPECTTPLNYTEGRQPNSAEPDHIIPHANGGQDTLDNIRILCRRCNQSRGNRSLTPPPATPTTTTLVTW
jgi:5-methylcytosine-specific restriction protein A